MADLTFEQPLWSTAAAPAPEPVYTARIAPWAERENLCRAGSEVHPTQALGDHPDWCHAVEAAYPGSMQLVMVTGGSVSYPVPMTLKRCNFDCQLGELKVLRFRPWILQPQADAPALPAKEDAYTAFIEALLAARGAAGQFQALRFSLPTASAFWRFLTSSALNAFPLLRYQPAPAAPHYYIRMPASFEAYLGKFTPKTRKNRLRELRYLEEKGQVALACYRKPSEVEQFLEPATAISRASYQGKLLGLRLDPQRLRPRLQIAAERGWFRSYILRCGGTPCSFLLGYQYQGRYHYTAIGYDPGWHDLCPGTVLQLLVLRDMFERDPPSIFDLGSYGLQKQYFGNAAFEEGTVYLFRSSAYGRFLRASHRHSRRLAAGGRVLLTRFNWHNRAQQFLRRAHGC